MSKLAPLLSLVNPPLGFFLLGRQRWALLYLVVFGLSLALNRMAIGSLNSFVVLEPFGFALLVALVAAVHAGILSRQVKGAPLAVSLPMLPVALFSLALPWLVSAYHSEILKVQSLSMAPSLQKGELVVARKFSTLNRWLHPGSSIETLARGDRIVFLSPGDERYYVKRLVGLPGDKVQIESGQLTINQLPVRQDFVNANRRSDVHLEHLKDVSYPIIRAHKSQSPDVDILVPGGAYFVLGDSRDNSKDSRHFGVVEKGALLGVVAGVHAR